MFDLEKVIGNRKIDVQLLEWIPGLCFLAILAFVSHQLGNNLPLFGGVIIAIILGFLFRNIISIKPVFHPGIDFTVKKVLRVAIILLGSGLSITQIFSIGYQSLLIIISVVSLGILLTICFGKLLKIDSTLAILIGIGTGICGATAITATKGVVSAKETQTAYAITTIFFFNLLATFLFPMIGHLFQMSSEMFGIWTGTAVHDTSSVVAVGYMYGDDAGKIATTVKLVRTVFLIPVIILISIWVAKSTQSEHTGSREIFQKIKAYFPLFILGFVGMSILNSIGIFSPSVSESFVFTAKFLILMVMVGVGTQIDWTGFSKLGIKPLLTGLFASICVSAVSLLLIILLNLG